MLPRPLRSTLFPYTTLFRSERGVTNRLISDESGAHMPVWSPDGNRVLFSSNRNGGNDLYWMHADGSGRDELALRQDGIHQIPTDRKSTRLNSSHSQISYAVF